VPILGRRANKALFYRDPIAYHLHVYRTYGTLAAFVQGGNKILLYAPEYNRQVMTQTDVFHADRVAVPGPPGSALHRLGMGLNSMNGEQHRQRRQLVMPVFHRQRIESYHDEIVAITDFCLDGWQTGQLYNIASEMHKMTMCIASQVFFGIDARSSGDSLAHLLSDWLDYMSSVIARMLPFAYPGSPFTRLLEISGQVEAQILEMIAQRRSNLAGSHDILALLIQAHDADSNDLSDDELIGQITLFFLSSFETTAVALIWTLFLLAQHPHVLADLLDELDGALHGAAPRVEQLAALPLLDAVIKESMRLVPPAIQGGRISVAPFEMGPYHFPAGTKVMYSQYITHRLPELYPQPQRFLPERWRTIDPSPYEYLPFLGGPRMCLGAPFATMEMKIVLAMIVQRYRLALPENVTVDRRAKMTLAPKYGMPMFVASQDRQFTKATVRGNIHEMVDLN
jgi:cytochrome P450